MNIHNPITYQLVDKRTGHKLAECITCRELLNTIALSLRKRLPNNKEKNGILPKLDDERYYIRIAWAGQKD